MLKDNHNNKYQIYFLKIFAITFFTCLSFVLLFNYFFDPIQYYRYSEKKSLNGNDRWQVAGFLRTFNYDQIILGTSMTQNFSQKLIEKVLETKPIRLSVAGSTIQEQAVILRAAIDQQKLKSVIWGLDRGYLNYKPGVLQPSFPQNLYYQNIAGHLSYLLNINTIYSAIKNLNFWRKPKLTSSTLDEYNMWYKQFTFSKDIILNLYADHIKNVSKQKITKALKMQKNKNVKKSSKSYILNNEESILKDSIAQSIQNFNRDVLMIIKENPHIHFEIFFPPYSLAHYKSNYLINEQDFAKDAYLRHYIAMQLLQLPNVRLHDFEINLNIIANLNNYKDIIHYSKGINDQIIYAIKNKNSLIHAETLQANQEAFLNLPYQDFL